MPSAAAGSPRERSKRSRLTGSQGLRRPAGVRERAAERVAKRRPPRPDSGYDSALRLRLIPREPVKQVVAAAAEKGWALQRDPVGPWLRWLRWT
jgi:hypothetical protein